MSSIREIASKTGVSLATVSRVLNGREGVHPDTRSRVIAMARELGYVTPSEREGSQRIALVYPGPVWHAHNSPFDSGVLRGICEAMSDFDFDLQIVELRKLRESGESFDAGLRRKGINAAIVRCDDPTLHDAEKLALSGMPTVLLGERSDDERVAYVGCNTRAASAELVEHLVGLGHERIALCTNHIPTSDHHDRINGWRDALQRNGLHCDDDLIVRFPASVENGAVLLRRLLSMGARPTAVFVTDPLLGVGAICEAQRMGISVPSDISIAGVDDTEMRMLTFPDMTCVVQDSIEVGRRAVEAMRYALQGEPRPSTRDPIAGWVEIRGSTGPAPTQQRRSEVARGQGVLTSLKPRDARADQRVVQIEEEEMR